jgi:hypothetical protein
LLAVCRWRRCAHETHHHHHSGPRMPGTSAQCRPFRQCPDAGAGLHHPSPRPGAAVAAHLRDLPDDRPARRRGRALQSALADRGGNV